MIHILSDSKRSELKIYIKQPQPKHYPYRQANTIR